MLKKILITLTLFTFLTTSIFAPMVKAQSWYNPNFQEWNKKVFDSPENEIFGERYTYAQVKWIFWSILMLPWTEVLGSDFINCILNQNSEDCINTFISPTSQNIELEKSVVIQDNQSLIGAIFEERPLSGITYFKNILRKHSIIPEAQAQGGFGYTKALLPVLSMWKASRNVAYGLFVILVVALSFMIMFRVKISPQTVISVQSALPKIVLAIILITFSYAIAGFLIDLMYVFFGLLSMLGSYFLPVKSSPGNILAVFNFMTKGHWLNLDVQIGVFGLMNLYFILFLIGALIILFTINGLLGTFLLTAAAGAAISAIAATGFGTLFIVLVLFIVCIIILWMVIRILFMLIKTYAKVILLTVFAPFQMAFGVLVPSMGFGHWLKSMISALSVFLMIGAMFLLSFIFLIQGVTLAIMDFAGENFGENTLNFFFGTAIPDLFGRVVSGESAAGWPPLLGGATMAPLLLLGVSLIIFIAIPKAADIIKGMIEGKPFAFGSALGEAVTPITAGWGMIQRSAPYRAYSEYAGALMGAKILSGVADRWPKTTPGGILPSKQDLRDLSEQMKRKGAPPQ